MLSLLEILPIIGYAGIAGIVFAECGLLVGVFLPGDSLLFTAGFLASQGVFNIVILCSVSFIAAIAGDSAGYWLGHRLGRRIFQREESFFFHYRNLERAERFYAQHGGKAIILARFTPIIRTFSPVLAGVGAMPYKRFVAYDAVGGTLWGIGVPLGGYWLGSLIPNVDRYLLPIVIGIILLSLSPTIIHVLKNKEDREHLMASLKNMRQKLMDKVF